LINPVGGTNPYKFVSSNFVATADTMSLALDNSSAADLTLLLDAFSVAEVTPRITVSAWTDDATSEIDGSLTYTHAFNLGSATNAVVNGQTFTGIVGGNPGLAGSFSYNMGNAAADAANNISSGGSEILADNFVFNNANASLTLEGLVAGRTYRTSLFTVGFDALGYGRAATIVSPDGEMLTVEVNTNGNNNGVRIDIEFTASGASEVIALNSLLSTQTFHTYAFSNALLSPSSAIVVDSITTGVGELEGSQVTIDFSTSELVDVYASNDLLVWERIATDIAISPFIEDGVSDSKRFYVLVTAGTAFPPAP
jgi:hypothetical protein